MKLGALILGVLAIGAMPLERSAHYVAERQQSGGGFAEPGGSPDPALTGWAVVGLRALGRGPKNPREAAGYLQNARIETASDLALRILALRALGESTETLVTRLESQRREDGRIGALVNSTAWGVIALRGAGRPAGAASVRYLRRQQRQSGGWPWSPGGAADSNDTAVAIQALRAAGVSTRSAAMTRGLRYLRRLQNRDGGFALTPGRASDSQSTAWAIQGFLAAGRKPGTRAYAFLTRMRRSDGSYRYSARYAVTPLWVTAQVLPALAGEPFPFRSYTR